MPSPCTIHRHIRLLAAVFLLLAGAAHATPDQFRFRSLTDALAPSGAVFINTWSQRQFSIGSAINNNGHLFGTLLTGDGSWISFNMGLDGPPYVVASTPDFIFLAANNAACSLFCLAQPFGIRLTSSGAVTAFLNSPTDTAAVPDSLPFSRYPGNFVEENDAGVVATTQVTSTGQYGAVIDPQNGSLLVLNDVPWLVAINNQPEPQVIGYDGSDGGCLIYGQGCVPDPCQGGDGHQHERGRGHREHGQGHGYGHDDCNCPTTGEGSTTGGALLIQTHTNDTSERYRFPDQLEGNWSGATLSRTFPVALNDDTVVLRADMRWNGQDYPDRLFQCIYDPAAIDANSDGKVDCTGGIQPLGDPVDSPDFGTVLGFTLNDDGLLVGNLGYSAAGIGTPFFMNIGAASPTPEMLVNRTSDAQSWELNTVTDINAAGKAIGYGYQDCSNEPETFTLDPVTSTGSSLAFHYSSLEQDPVLMPSDSVTLTPHVTGGSGQYEYRTETRQPGDSGWQLLQDWQSGDAGSWQPNGYLGDVCFRIQVRDAQAPTSVQSEIVRFRVTDQPASSSPVAQMNWSDAATGQTQDILGLGTAGPFLFAGLFLLAFRRRT